MKTLSARQKQNRQTIELTVTLQSKALYTFTTTTGQQKAITTPAENKPFPFPFKLVFDSLSRVENRNYHIINS